MRNFKKTLALVLSVIMAFSVMAVAFIPAGAASSDEYVYTNSLWGSAQENIIEKIYYELQSDGTFNAKVKVNISCFDKQIRDLVVKGIGFYSYDTDGKLGKGSVGYDFANEEYTFDVCKNLEPGKNWKVKVYLSEDYYADYELDGYSFSFVEDEVPYPHLGGVKAVADGIVYDDENEGYKVEFSLIKALATNGYAIENEIVIHNLYNEYKSGQTSDILKTEPEIGETYYSSFRIDNPSGDKDFDEKLFDVEIPGYKVNYVTSHARDMGYGIQVVYSITSSYKIEVEGGTATLDRGVVGTVATIKADEVDGKIFKEWSIKGATVEDKNAAETEITVEGDVTAEAIYDDCDCKCHKGGISALLFKIILFFQKLFGRNKVCVCGAAH